VICAFEVTGNYHRPIAWRLIEFGSARQCRLPGPGKRCTTIIRRTKAWLGDQPAARFEFTVIPAPGPTSLRAFFKLARSVLPQFRVTSALDDINQYPSCILEPTNRKSRMI
jgi:hypothetical protein